MNDKRQLMSAVYQTGFALDDATLYLDTHPCDEHALEYYNTMKRNEKCVYWDFSHIVMLIKT